MLVSGFNSVDETRGEKATGETSEYGKNVFGFDYSSYRCTVVLFNISPSPLGFLSGEKDFSPPE